MLLSFSFHFISLHCFSPSPISIQTLAFATKEITDKAKARKIQPKDMEGGTFTISNLGMFGIKSFSAIINPPQAAILAVGASEERVVKTGDGTFGTETVMEVTLSCDHRAVDGVLGAKWLGAFKKFIEEPSLMML